MTAVIDPLNRRTEYTYDSKGNVLTVTRLAGTANTVTTTFTYDAGFREGTRASAGGEDSVGGSGR